MFFFSKALDYSHKLVRNKIIQATAYGTFQMSIVKMYRLLLIQFYQLELDNGTDPNQIIFDQTLYISQFCLGALGSIYSGKHLQTLENQKSTRQNLIEAKPSLIAKYFSRFLAAEIGFNTGAQSYAFVVGRFIDNITINRIGMSISGCIAAALMSVIATKAKLERAEAKLVLPKLFPKKHPTHPLATRDVVISDRKSKLFLQSFRHMAYIMPAYRSSNAVNFLILIMTSSPDGIDSAYRFGIYSNLIGICAGIANLLAFLFIPSYLGVFNKNSMNYLLYGSYILIALATEVNDLMRYLGDNKDAYDPIMGGWLLALAGIASILAFAPVHEQHRLQLILREQVLQHRSLKRNGTYIYATEAPLQEISTASSDTSSLIVNEEQSNLTETLPTESQTSSETWTHWGKRKISECASMFRNCFWKQQHNTRQPIQEDEQILNTQL